MGLDDNGSKHANARVNGGVGGGGGEVQIEPTDEGEVLLRKINEQKNENDRVKLELRSCEEKLNSANFKPATSKNTSDKNAKEAVVASGEQETARLVPNAENQYASPKNPDVYDEADAYKILEEKHRLSGGTTWASTCVSTNSVSGSSAFSPESSLSTHDSSGAVASQSNLSGTTNARWMSGTSSTQRSNTDDDANPVEVLDSSSIDRGKEVSENTKKDSASMLDPTAPRRFGSDASPGAIPVEGIDSSRFSRHSTIRIGEGADQDSATINLYQGDSLGSSNEILIEANLVDEESGARLVAAKIDPWYRRNQWWLAGGLVLIVAAIVLSIVLTSIDLDPAPAPTMAPTTLLEGTKVEMEAIILSSFPAAADQLANETSPQAEALRWVTERRFNDSSYFSDARILQQYALATFFLSTLGASSWSRADNWMNDMDECSWYGVDCEATIGRREGGESIVVGLSLPSNKLSGSIPSDLSILRALTSLDFSLNWLSGSIVSEIGLLSSLTSIKLSRNRLVNTMPPTIKNLSKLENLSLSHNLLTGSIPSEVGLLTMLRSFDMKHNGLTEALPSEIGQLKRLEYLECDSNRLAFAIPSQIGLLTGLTVLHGSSNAFVNSLPSELGPLSSLVSFDLSHNLIGGTIPYQITLLSNLTLLDLSFNLLTGTVPQNMGLLRSLHSLHLSDNELENLLPESIGSLRDLMHLDVSGNGIYEQPSFSSEAGQQPRDVPWLQLSRLTNLVTLDLGGMRIWYYAGELLRLTNLEVLGLAGSEIDYDGLLQSLSSLTKLREIDFSNARQRWAPFPNELSLLVDLEVLDLRGILLSGTLATELGSLSLLSILNLEGSSISGTIPSELFKLSDLIYLSLSGGFRQSFSDEPGKNGLVGSIPSHIGRLTKLRQLNLSFSQITGSIPSEIGLTQLEEIHLHNTAISGTIANELQSLLQLRVFDVHKTQLTGFLPEFGAKFEKIQRIDISSTSFHGSIPSSIWELSTLKLLAIGCDNGDCLTGSIPSEIAVLSSLTHLSLVGINLKGTSIPPEIGSLAELEVLELVDAGISGTIPPELFLCTQLTTLYMGYDAYNGSLPTEIGIASNLLDLQISNAQITGKIPTEMGNLVLLERLDLSHTDISGTILSELHVHFGLLEDLNLEATDISGTIPPEISDLLSLRQLSLSNTTIRGTIPSEIGLMLALTDFDISFTSIEGTIPIEMSNATVLTEIDLRGVLITGTIPDTLCDPSISYSGGGLPTFQERFVYLGCSDVLFCRCCQYECVFSGP